MSKRSLWEIVKRLVRKLTFLGIPNGCFRKLSLMESLETVLSNRLIFFPILFFFVIFFIADLAKSRFTSIPSERYSPPRHTDKRCSHTVPKDVVVLFQILKHQIKIIILNESNHNFTVLKVRISYDKQKDECQT